MAYIGLVHKSTSGFSWIDNNSPAYTNANPSEFKNLYFKLNYLNYEQGKCLFLITV